MTKNYEKEKNARLWLAFRSECTNGSHTFKLRRKHYDAIARNFHGNLAHFFWRATTMRRSALSHSTEATYYNRSSKIVLLRYGCWTDIDEQTNIHPSKKPTTK